MPTPQQASPFFAASPKRIATTHAELSYRSFGQGPAILFVHGWPLHSATYRQVAAQLCDRYTCYLVDLPGAGASSSYSEWRDPLRMHTDTLLEFVAALELDSFALIAHDSGGAIARWLAAELGDRISALVLSNTEITGHVVKMVKRYAQFTRLPGSLHLLRGLFARPSFLRSRYGFAGCFSDRDYVGGEFHRLFLAPLLEDAHRFRDTMGMLANVDFEKLADLAPIHARIVAPTRFVWGAQDPFFPIAGARAMAREIPGFETLVEVPHGKLFFHEEFPEIFATAAGDFLDTVMARPELSLRPDATRRLI